MPAVEVGGAPDPGRHPRLGSGAIADADRPPSGKVPGSFHPEASPQSQLLAAGYAVGTPPLEVAATGSCPRPRGGVTSRSPPSSTPGQDLALGLVEVDAGEGPLRRHRLHRRRRPATTP